MTEVMKTNETETQENFRNQGLCVRSSLVQLATRTTKLKRHLKFNCAFTTHVEGSDVLMFCVTTVLIGVRRQMLHCLLDLCCFKHFVPRTLVFYSFLKT